MEVDGNEQPAGRFGVQQKPPGIAKPAGKWPEHWIDPIHRFDWHGNSDEGDDRAREELLCNELGVLYFLNGIKTACDSVNRSWLDLPGLKMGRDVKMTLL